MTLAVSECFEQLSHSHYLILAHLNLAIHFKPRLGTFHRQGNVFSLKTLGDTQFLAFRPFDVAMLLSIMKRFEQLQTAERTVALESIVVERFVGIIEQQRLDGFPVLFLLGAIALCALRIAFNYSRNRIASSSRHEAWPLGTKRTGRDIGKKTIARWTHSHSEHIVGINLLHIGLVLVDHVAEHSSGVTDISQ